MISESKRRLVARLREPRLRRRDKLTLAEGPKVVLEALRARVPMRWLLLGEEFAKRNGGQQVLATCEAYGGQAELVADQDLRKLCAAKAPQPVLMAVEAPELKAQALDRGRYLWADGVQDPGNLGTLVRSAWGFGLDGVVIGEGTVDPWNEKVVRASAGAVFRVKLLRTPDETTRIPGAPCYLWADATGAAVDEVAKSLGLNWVLVVGNEGRGVSEPMRQVGVPVAVPLTEGVDSLNVAMAGSVLIYALTSIGRAR